MDLSWLSAILVGAGCLALGYCIGARYPAPFFMSARLAKGSALVSTDNKNKKYKPKDPLEIEKLADLLGNFKMVLVVRNDLKMGKGKIAAQCSHATLGLYKKLLHRAPKALNSWEMCAQPKVVVKIESEEDMLVLQGRAKSLKLPTHITIDAGRTQIAPNSRTVMAILGPVEVVDDVTGLIDQYHHRLRPQTTVIDEVPSSITGWSGIVYGPTVSAAENELHSAAGGRRFNIGKINGVDIIYVMTGEQIVNAGITVQILVDAFDVKGIVHYGIAGSTNNSLSVGDVSVPSSVAFTSSWKWKEFKSEQKGQYPELKFADFNFPIQGDNLLGKVEFTPQQLYSSEKPMQEVFWLPIDPKWFSIASQLKDLKLQRCLNETYCLPETPQVIYGLRGSTADTFLDNAAYRDFLFKQFNVSTVDEESAAVMMTCLSNGVPCIVFRGVSDLAGGGGKQLPTSLRSLAAVNALSVAAAASPFLSDVDHFNWMHTFSVGNVWLNAFQIILQILLGIAVPLTLAMKDEIEVAECDQYIPRYHTMMFLDALIDIVNVNIEFCSACSRGFSMPLLEYTRQFHTVA
ncbi:hypothetical protein FNV43_RR23758 [Rhamnella rubrinervis]|uniref:peptidyl-tRNA hydrolase n=1 Tax=Rhamnella rubrinervis TaxID=2594499 RepID=A0A8K0GPM6_9ROSA|nr:hypothetical protein FNV43_RR23758 [Rhamnella rubrinervis]